MAVLGKRKVLIFSMSLIIMVFCNHANSVTAQGGAGILFQRALYCFNNKVIYSGCNEAFRLDESGQIKVPLEASNLFCNGPCLVETELVLQCVDNVMSDFVFSNRATSRDIRNALRFRCNGRGNFNARDYIPGYIFSKAGNRLPGLISVYAPAVITGYAWMIL